MRGWEPATELAQELATITSLPLELGLQWLREPRDQRGLSPNERRENLHLAMQARQDWRDVVLIDDVLTTGASAEEAIRAVEAAGGSVAGVLVVVATRRGPLIG